MIWRSGILAPWRLGGGAGPRRKSARLIGLSL